MSKVQKCPCCKCKKKLTKFDKNRLEPAYNIPNIREFKDYCNSCIINNSHILIALKPVSEIFDILWDLVNSINGLNDHKIIIEMLQIIPYFEEILEKRGFPKDFIGFSYYLYDFNKDLSSYKPKNLYDPKIKLLKEFPNPPPNYDGKNKVIRCRNKECTTLLLYGRGNSYCFYHRCLKCPKPLTKKYYCDTCT